MIELLRDLASWVLILAGSFFLVSGAIGLNRMPDLFSRLHATGVSDTVGACALLLGFIFQAGFTLVSVKLVFLILIFLFTSPAAAHAVTRAALSVGVRPLLFDESGRQRRSAIEDLNRFMSGDRPESAKPKSGGKPARKKGGRSSKR